ncbi:hypothetical protein FKR81_33905 [Lentzea tibetensis]|uniref:Uncharacterized protein n=1 Tax=Lentzea tibetensis TaxID=2591470 RepID=A0A563EJV8_9PSEU|nr:hypothetical protein [Lentzea tibetensis]TWP47043.1 hypothetical protein FKR81_33905 [Lentzea tibetensis]
MRKHHQRTPAGRPRRAVHHRGELDVGEPLARAVVKPGGLESGITKYSLLTTSAPAVSAGATTTSASANASAALPCAMR